MTDQAPMTAQDVFDRVVAHLATMAAPSTDEGGMCLYRTQDGDRCAIGALIPDELYCEDMESQAASEVLMFWPDVAALFDDSVSKDMLNRLQAAHDTEDHWDGHFTGWGSIGRIAAEYGLSFTPPKAER